MCYGHQRRLPVTLLTGCLDRLLTFGLGATSSGVGVSFTSSSTLYSSLLNEGGVKPVAPQGVCRFPSVDASRYHNPSRSDVIMLPLPKVDSIREVGVSNETIPASRISRVLFSSALRYVANSTCGVPETQVSRRMPIPSLHHNGVYPSGCLGSASVNHSRDRLLRRKKEKLDPNRMECLRFRRSMAAHVVVVCLL